MLVFWGVLCCLGNSVGCTSAYFSPSSPETTIFPGSMGIRLKDKLSCASTALQPKKNDAGVIFGPRTNRVFYVFLFFRVVLVATFRLDFGPVRSFPCRMSSYIIYVLYIQYIFMCVN